MRIFASSSAPFQPNPQPSPRLCRHNIYDSLVDNGHCADNQDFPWVGTVTRVKDGGAALSQFNFLWCFLPLHA